MIRPGGPEICGACLTLAHAPTPDCPDPWVADPGDLPALDPFTQHQRRQNQ
jgi:hypothetical protein